jgi:hypothetical protein
MAVAADLDRQYPSTVSALSIGGERRGVLGVPLKRGTVSTLNFAR